MEWNIEWFPKSPGYWEDKKNQREFFDSLARKFNIQEPKDWGKLNTSTIKKHGGACVLYHYKGVLLAALRSVYPSNNSFSVKNSYGKISNSIRNGSQ